MNGATCGYGNIGFTTFKLSQFRPNAIASCEPDEGNPIFINDGAFSPNEAISQRHQVGANVGRFDGGAEFMTSSHFYLERAKTMPNRVWCNPGTLTGQ